MFEHVVNKLFVVRAARLYHYLVCPCNAWGCPKCSFNVKPYKITLWSEWCHSWHFIIPVLFHCGVRVLVANTQSRCFFPCMWDCSCQCSRHLSLNALHGSSLLQTDAIRLRSSPAASSMSPAMRILLLFCLHHPQVLFLCLS